MSKSSNRMVGSTATIRQLKGRFNDSMVTTRRFRGRSTVTTRYDSTIERQVRRFNGYDPTVQMQVRRLNGRFGGYGYDRTVRRFWHLFDSLTSIWL